LTMATRPNVLIVTEDPSRLNRWALWLEGEGFVVSSCSGPHLNPQCPRMDGVACSIRQRADMAVVDVHPLGTNELYGGWAARACTKIPDDCRTVFVHEPRLGMRFREEGIHMDERVDRESLLSAVRKVKRIFSASARA
jgi:hypothetical protein